MISYYGLIPEERSEVRRCLCRPNVNDIRLVLIYLLLNCWDVNLL